MKVDRAECLVWVLFLFFLSTSSIKTPAETLSMLRCAKQGMLLYPCDQECHLPISQGPCGEGEMIVMGSEGVGECVGNPCAEDMMWTGEVCVEMYRQERCGGRGERMLYNMTGGVECGCEDGWGRVGGVCHQHSTQGPCKQDDLLMESDTAEDCQCVHHLSCPSFMLDLSSLAVYRGQALQHQAGVARLSAQVCRQQLQHVCCQAGQTLTAPLQIAEVLNLLTLYHGLHLSCSPSPCPSSTPSSLPWPGRQGCFSVSTSVPSQGCVLDLVMEEKREVMTCVEDDMEISIRNVPMAYSHKCSQGRIWSRFRRRCVKNFF